MTKGYNRLTKREKEELQKLADEIMNEAKDVVEDYEINPSELSGSITQVHIDSPILVSREERLIKFDNKDFKIKIDKKEKP